MGSEKYWAAVDTSEIGERLKEKFEAWRTAAKDCEHSSQVATAYTHYFGRDIEGVGANAAGVARSGEQGELAEVRVPHARALANGVLNIVTGPKVVWNALPTTNDFEARAACVTASNACEYYWKDRQVAARAVEAALHAVVFGEGFLFTPWDPHEGPDVAALGDKLIRGGDIAYRVVPTWDTMRDPTVKAFDSLTNFAVVLWENRFDVAARCQDEETAAEVLKRGSVWFSDGEQVDPAQTDSDIIPVVYWFHQRTPALPRGRETVLLPDGLVISDGELHQAHWKALPVHRLSAGELAGTPWPFASFWTALGVQQVSDSIHSSLTTNITTTAPGLVSVETTSEISSDSIAGGPKVVYRAAGTQPPVAIQLQQASAESFKYLQLLRQEAQQLVGLNSTTLGQPEGANLSGAAMALLSSMSIQANSDLQAKWVAFIERVGNATLQHIAHRMPVPRKVALSGKGRSHLVKATEFSGPALQGVDRVLVEIGNPLQQTAAGRMELAQLYNGAGFTKTPEQLAAVVETGRLDPLTQNLSNQLLLIAQENDALARGENPPVSLFDDQRLHLLEHPAVSASLEARADPKVMAALQAHCDEHIRILRETDPAILAVLGQQPLAPPGQPPGAPPDVGAAVAPPPAPGDAPADVNMPGLPTNPATGEPAGAVAGLPPTPAVPSA